MKANLIRSLCLPGAVAVLVLSCPTPPMAASSAQQVKGREGLTLEEVVRLALEHSPQLKASGARVEAAAGRSHQATRWANPELALNAEDVPISRGRGFADSKQSIGISQTLPYPGKKPLDRRIGDREVKLTEAELALRRTEVVRDVKAAFYRVLTAEKVVEVSKELVTADDASAGTATKRVDAGAVAYQEQLRAEVLLEHARSELGDFELELETAKTVLSTLAGRPDLREARLAGTLKETPDDTLSGSMNAGVFERHPSATAARENVKAAALKHRRARLDPYPDVDVGLGGGRYGDSGDTFVELKFSVPLPLLDRGKGNEREARANVSLAEAELEGIQHELQRELRMAQTRHSIAVTQVTNHRERLLPKANEALRLVRTGFEEGKFGFIDLVDTQRMAAEARLAYQKKLLEMNIAETELEALVRPQTIQSSTIK